MTQYAMSSMFLDLTYQLTKQLNFLFFHSLSSNKKYIFSKINITMFKKPAHRQNTHRIVTKRIVVCILEMSTT